MTLQDSVDFRDVPGHEGSGISRVAETNLIRLRLDRLQSVSLCFSIILTLRLVPLRTLNPSSMSLDQSFGQLMYVFKRSDSGEMFNFFPLLLRPHASAGAFWLHSTVRRLFACKQTRSYRCLWKSPSFSAYRLAPHVLVSAFSPFFTRLPPASTAKRNNR